MKPQGLYVSPDQYVRFAEAPQRLSDHIATRDRSPDFTALGLYLPNPDPILKKQGRDLTVYSDLRSDAHVGGCIRRRKAAVQAMESRVVRDKASARTAKLCEAALAGLALRRLIHEMLDAVLFGWQPLEVIWSPPSAGAIVPRDVLAKPATWFHFDTEARLRFKSRDNPLYGEELDPRKFLVPTQEASYANPYGFADLSMCFWPTVFKRGGLKFWVTFTEKFGTPWVVGKTPRGTGGPDQDKLLDQLEAMVQDAVAVIPDDSSVDIVEAGGKSANADLYERLLMFCRSEVSIALLGQNQSTEASSTYASAQAGLEVGKDLRDGDARLVEAAFNQLLRWITDLNDGEGAPAPKFELYEQEEVNEVQARRDKLLTEAGVSFTPAYWQRVYGLEEGDIAPLSPPAGQPPASAAPRQAPAFAEAPPVADPPDEIDALVAAELAQWQPMMAPMAATVQAAIDKAVARGETAEQLIARLPDLLAEMDADALAQALTRSAFTARLGAAAGLDQPGPSHPSFAEGPPADPLPAQIGAGITAIAAAMTAIAARPDTPASVINVQVPEQSAPVVHVDVTQPPPAPAPVVQVAVHVPEQPAPVVNLSTDVHPAPVTVHNTHPARAVQTVQRDSNDEIVSTTTVYHQE